MSKKVASDKQEEEKKPLSNHPDSVIERHWRRFRQANPAIGRGNDAVFKAYREACWAKWAKCLTDEDGIL